jgi:hypothetical protein
MRQRVFITLAAASDRNAAPNTERPSRTDSPPCLGLRAAARGIEELSPLPAAIFRNSLGRAIRPATNPNQFLGAAVVIIFSVPA